MKMKSTIILITFVILYSLTNSCKKDSTDSPLTPPVVTGIISLTDLMGNWNFVSMQYNSKTYNSYTDIDKDSNLPTTNMGAINLAISPATIIVGDPFDGWVVLTKDGYTNNNNSPITFTLNGSTNKMSWDNGIVFQIISYTSSTKTLVVKTVSTTLLVNVTYTLKK